MVIGDFTLGDEFKEGSYRMRSYTQWMRNSGEDYFFDRTFTVGNIANSNIVTKADYQYKDIDGKPILTATLNYSNDEVQAPCRQGCALPDNDQQKSGLVYLCQNRCTG